MRRTRFPRPPARGSLCVPLSGRAGRDPETPALSAAARRASPVAGVRRREKGAPAVMPEPEHATITAELTELRRSLDVGFTRMDGRLALLVQRGEHIQKGLDDLEARVTALERGRWPLPGVAALTGLCALVVATWQAVGH